MKNGDVLWFVVVAGKLLRECDLEHGEAENSEKAWC